MDTITTILAPTGKRRLVTAHTQDGRVRTLGHIPRSDVVVLLEPNARRVRDRGRSGPELHIVHQGIGAIR
jgi:hypothetical protein